MGSIGDFFFGQKGSIQNLPVLSREQQDLLGQLLGGLGGPLGLGLNNLTQMLSGSPEALEAFQRPAMRQFEQEIVPGIAERFTQAGGQRSSAFGQQLGQAGANLAENLSAQRAGLQQNSLQQLLALLGQGLGTQTFKPFQIPGSSGFLQGLSGGIGSGLGSFGSLGLGRLLGF